MTNDESTAPSPRRHYGRVVHIGLAVTLVGKLALVAVHYAGGIPPAAAIAAETRDTRGADTAAKSAGSASEETIARGSVSVAGAPRQLASLDRPAVEAGGKRPEARALVDAIARRQAELDGRERELAAREERLRVFEQDVVAKVASLEEIEKRLQGRAKAASAAVDAAAELLAKVYGAMKPADAAPILERLDEATVLSIFGRMKEKQIGEILPLMTKDKAIALTHALATSAPR
jgi:flagellar protein FlbB